MDEGFDRQGLCTERVFSLDQLQEGLLIPRTVGNTICIHNGEIHLVSVGLIALHCMTSTSRDILCLTYSPRIGFWFRITWLKFRLTVSVPEDPMSRGLNIAETAVMNRRYKSIPYGVP
jgi:hypothetical protein